MDAAVDFLTIDLLSAGEATAIAEELRAASGHAATVYGQSQTGAVHPLVRKATRVVPSEATVALIRAALLRVLPELASHFATPLTSCEEPQFLRYAIGDYFVAHQDGNTPLIHDDSRHRRVSAIIFLSDPADYEGGALVFHGRYPDTMQRLAVPCHRGSLLAFRPERTHEVTPLTAGSRFTIATWYR